ncbi:MAG TPA: YciI family protein [Candidatus Saccharimonadia bacterium]|nr:YciI family protein [Candidatus Saccharimonadia bacterium]
MGTPDQLNGFTIIQAENMDEALKLVDGHPFLSDKTGNFSVEVFELLPTPM